MKKILYLFSVCLLAVSANAQCPPAITFTQPGLFWKPDTASGGWKRLSYQPPAGTYKKIHLKMDLKIPYWYAPHPSSQYQVFWLARDGKNSDMFGYVGIFGPTKNNIMLRHGWNDPGWAKAKLVEKYTFVKGTIYHLDYTYDAAGGLVQLIVTDKSINEQTINIVHAPNTTNFTFTASQPVVIDFGFPETANTAEVPSYGWEYSNLTIDLYSAAPPVVNSSSVVGATCLTCPDASASINVSGGSAPYTYLWSNGATTSALNGINPGGYTVAVTDSKSCVAKKNVPVGILPNANAVTPIKISSDDPHWLEYKGKLTYMAGFTHGLGNVGGQKATYYKTYIDWLASHNLNCFRNTPFMGQEYFSSSQPPPAPFKRTGPGLANDGFAKYDLTQYDPAFFNYWKTLLTYALSKDIIVFINILDGWHMRQWDKNGCNGHPTGATDEFCHTYDVYYGANNINGVDSKNIVDYHDPSHPVNAWQKKFIEKMVDELGAFPNVIFEVCNENWQNQVWEDKLDDYLTSYELSKGMQPHIVMSRDIPNHWQIPCAASMTQPELHDMLYAVQVKPQPHVFHNDGANQGSSAFSRNQSWASLTAGANTNILTVTNWSLNDSTEMASADFQDRLKYTGFVRKFLADFNVDLRGMKADSTLVTNDTNDIWCLARTGQEYVIYFMKGGNTTVSGLPATYDAYWFNPRTGTSQAATPVSGSKFVTSDNNDWVLYIRKPKKTDILPSLVSSPKAYNCKDTSDITVLIQNNGGLDLYNLKLNYKLDNGSVVSKTQTLSPWLKANEKRVVYLIKELKGLTAGNHTLKIWTSNPNDASDSNTANDTLTYAFKVTSAGKALIFSENFESGLPADWNLFNPDGKSNWFAYNGAGYNSSASMALNNFGYTGAYFEPDYIVMPEVDLTSAANPSMSFWYSHASKPAAYRYDSLEVLISTDCNKTLHSIWSKGGSALNTAAAAGSMFVPASAGDWKQEFIDLSAYKSSTNALIVFRNWSNNNNSILLDKINIVDSTVATAVVQNTDEFLVNVFPNPASESVQVNVALKNAGELQMKIVNSLGQVVDEINYGMQQSGFHTSAIDVRSYPAGIYDLLLFSGNNRVTAKKIVVSR